jgi:predicted  nucleic acid-binding Zn-ribbon protein
MTQDRNYLRMLSDSELVRTALDRNHELAVVLAERLSELLDVEDQLEDAKKEIVELNDRLDRWMEEANDLQAHIDATRGYGPDE